MDMDKTLQFMLLILVALLSHFVADFMFQQDKEAQKKSTSNYYLTYHVVKYSVIMALVIGPLLALINGVLHWVTDYFSSRTASYYYKKGDRHNFFVVIGFDQFLHSAALVVTIYYMCFGMFG